MVKVALDSILASEYKDWFLTVIDDSYVHLFPDKIEGFPSDSYKVIHIGDTPEQKKDGSRHGAFINEAIITGPGDIIVVLCDDDAIRHDGLAKLVEWFDSHPSEMSVWCKIIPFDPRSGRVPSEIKDAPEHPLNRHSIDKRLSCSCNVDSSQVYFRKSCFTECDVRYPVVETHALDSHLFTDINSKTGLTLNGPFVVQYKGIFPGQLTFRAGENTYSPLFTE